VEFAPVPGGAGDPGTPGAVALMVDLLPSTNAKLVVLILAEEVEVKFKWICRCWWFRRSYLISPNS
jgi:hypothetical protein